MTSDELQSQVIDFMRFPLIIGVVCIHSVLNLEGVNEPLWTEWIIKLFTYVLPSIAVPLFFLIAGYFFFYRGEGQVVTFNTTDYGHKLYRRIKTLLIPYLLWNIIYIIVRIGNTLPFFTTISTRVSATHLNLTFSSILHAFYDTTSDPLVLPASIDPLSLHLPADPPLWFLRDLIVLIILTPLFFFCIKRLKGYFPLLLGLLWIGLCGLSMTQEAQFLGSSFFFSIGAYFGIYGKNLINTIPKIKYSYIIYPLLSLLDVYLLLCGNTIIQSLVHCITIIVGSVVCINLSTTIIEGGYMTVKPLLTGSVFFIFALHWVVILILNKLIPILLGGVDNPITYIISWLLTIFCTVGICLGIYWFLHRFTPKLCGLLTGGR